MGSGLFYCSVPDASLFVVNALHLVIQNYLVGEDVLLKLFKVEFCLAHWAVELLCHGTVVVEKSLLIAFLF